MSIPSHLQIYNPNPDTHQKLSNLPLFPILPKELRLKIWRQALQRQRIIHLCLKGRQGAQTASQAAENVGVAPGNERYSIVVIGCQLLSKFLRVNRESREEALMFHRVHLPCEFSTGLTGEENTGHGVFHFNPEYDVLRISPGWPIRDTLLDFLYHLKKFHDPHHVGLLNLAVDGNGLSGHDLHMLQPSDIDSRVRAAFSETLTQLHEVFFISTPRAGRQVLGWWSGLGTSEEFFNRSFPIISMCPTFERLHRDPRPIEQDLTKVLEGTFDSRTMVRAWHQLLNKWRTHPPDIHYRFLLAFDPTLRGGPISCLTDAERFLQIEDDVWNGCAPDDGFLNNNDIKWPVGALRDKFKDEDLEKAVRPAFGFWLFTLDALGPLHEEGMPADEGFRSRGKALLDMTGHWPELALSTLT